LKKLLFRSCIFFSPKGSEMEKVLNINVGVLGHVDSGKTSLVRALSDTFSTASLDKSTQSRQRGITLDLGFSSFKTPIPPHLEEELRPQGVERLQFTLVDCPGHAGLMKTVIGGAQIIDLMILVIDVNKMIQVQTGECLVLGDILTETLIAVLNKCDTLDSLSQKSKEKTFKKKKKELRKVFKKTKFGKEVPIACVTANRGGQNAPGEDVEFDRDTSKTSTKSDIQELLDLLLSLVKVPQRNRKDFLYSVDHCFTIKGKGTILTGTVLQGTCKVNQIVELPALKVERKVKSMQAFRKPVQSAVAGDRVAMCLNQVSSSDLERAVVCEPGTVPTLKDVLVRVELVRFYKREVSSGVKFHVSIGHCTSMGLLTCFRDPTKSEYLDHGYRGEEKWNEPPRVPVLDESLGFDFSRDYLYLEQLEKDFKAGNQYCLLQFEKSVIAPADSIIIGSRLDMDTTDEMRIAFYGRVIETCPQPFTRLRVYKPKQRTGTVDRVSDDFTFIGKGLGFTKLTDLSVFTGLQVQLSTGQIGVIQGGFGKSGKYKVYVASGLPKSEEDKKNSSEGGKKKKKKRTLDATLVLKFKKYVFDVKSSKVAQTT